MGCDIHFFVEKRVDGCWQTADEWTVEDGRRDYQYDKLFYRGRHYDLFSILADVRNGTGFAGVKTGYGFVPIFPPRGVPADCCPEYAELVEQWGIDGHSHSWLTLQEILQYDWMQKSRKTGVVSPHELATWKLRGRPDRWAGAVGGGGVQTFPVSDIPEKELAGYLRLVADTRNVGPFGNSGPSFRGCDKPYFQVEWDTTYSEVGKQFLSTTVPRMAALVDSWTEVRAVFFFDN